MTHDEKNFNIIPIKEEGGERLVNARDLHNFLEVKRDFSSWIKYYLFHKDYCFESGVDFTTHSPKVGNRFDKPKTEYFLTTSCAKELSMVSRTNKGREARRYFIEVERGHKKTVVEMTSGEMLVAQAQKFLELERKQNEQEKAIKRLEAITERSSGNTGFLTITAYCRLNNISLPLKESQNYGRMASRISKEYGIKTGEVPDERFGSVKSYHTDILDEIFNK